MNYFFQNNLIVPPDWIPTFMVTVEAKTIGRPVGS
jgi:hypothetical protein